MVKNYIKESFLHLFLSPSFLLNLKVHFKLNYAQDRNNTTSDTMFLLNNYHIFDAIVPCKVNLIFIKFHYQLL